MTESITNCSEFLLPILFCSPQSHRNFRNTELVFCRLRYKLRSEFHAVAAKLHPLQGIPPNPPQTTMPVMDRYQKFPL